MEGDLIYINKKLRPLSWLYGLGVGFRNLLFETGILKSHTYATPVISVGNITVGGTGKTPHVEYLIRLLKDKTNLAVLSRGYKRKSRGFVLADNDSTMYDIGDEPFQMKQKFPDITVAVDKKRTRGISRLINGEAGKEIDVILLDDAFQHRYVKAGINILLVDYHRLIIYDELLPSGRLREPVGSKDRADIVIVTKCPTDIKPMEFRVITKAMALYPYQQLYFSTHEYGKLERLTEPADKAELTDLADKHVLLLTGIASPEQMKLDLESYAKDIQPLAFADHHQFKEKDIQRINDTFGSLPSPKCIITTEKDAVRLRTVEGLSDEVLQYLYVLPIRIRFMLDQEESFNKHIIDYVRKNSRNSILAKGKDDYKSKDSDHTGDRPRYSDIPNFPVSTVEGHSGKLIFGKLGGVDILAMQGRFHFYEGYSMKEVTFPVRVMYELGIKTLFVSNAAGGMNPRFNIGDLMVITDHINFFPEHPLRGKNFPTGPRFPDMHQTYDPLLIKMAYDIAREKGIPVQHGVYVGVQGPTFETPAEYKMYRIMGGDAVGMSTVPEVIVAHHCGIRTFGISVITDLGGFDEPVEVSHEEVQEAANKAQPFMTEIMRELIVWTAKFDYDQMASFNTNHPTEGWK